MTRYFLRSVCRALIGAVLLAQMAVSAYACPGLLSATAMKMPMAAAAPSGTGLIAAPTAAPALLPMNCDDMRKDMSMPMDPAFPNLCSEHCHQGQQSDQAATLTVPSALLTQLYVTPPAPEPAKAPRPAAAAARAADAASPPLAILHCCFRI